jgi:NTP pyrophosphatase (non-canonical NTP hydrolase)
MSKSQMRLEQLQKPIIEDMLVERLRQNMKFTKAPFGTQAHTIFTWLAILGEEVGEINQAALDLVFGKTYPSPEKLAELREECIQVGAVVLAIIERLDDNDESLWNEEPIMKGRHDKV